MTNLLEYVRTQADETMAEAPFDEADNLVLSQLSYPLWENGFSDGDCLTVAELWRRINGKPFTQGFTARNDYALLALAAQSERFSAIRCCHYVSEFDAAGGKQFAAISFLLPDDTVFVSFRGTDSSLTGWKEDFYLCLPDPIASQIRATEYLKHIAQTYPVPIRVGGHSKGGNLAVYASSLVPGDIQERLLDIYNNDGPGLSTGVFSGEGYSRIKARVHTFVPRSSVIGMLLMHSETYTVVRSSAFSIFQHNPYSWMIAERSFIREKDLGRESVYIEEVLRKWLEAVDDERRRLFIDSLFSVLEAAQARTFGREIWICILRNPASVLSAVQDIDPETKQKLLSTIVALAAAAIRYEKLSESVRPKLNEMKRRMNTMATKTMTESTKAFGVKQVLKYMNRNPEKNIPKVMNWLEKHDRGGDMAYQVQAAREAFEDKNNHWYKLAASLWTDVDDAQRMKLFENFVINVNMIGGPKQVRISNESGCSIPWAILMDPTSACNLHCAGCWANEYGDKLNLTLNEMDDVIRQGKAMGTYFYLFSGGEPTVRKDDIIRLCEMHPDCAFLAFTNGTLIDEAFADEMLRVKNFVPAISVEGFEDATDSRRGKGTYNKVVETMKLLRRKKLLFGISLCYTSANTEVIGSDAYIDQMIEYGAKFAWFFTYIPVGEAAVPALIATAEQRRFMYDKIRAWRKEKQIFTLDFWNDGEFVSGCIAGGRRYFHINAKGDIEPCAFIHYADSNIRTHTLMEALHRPLFMAYRQNQPFNANMLRPCPLLDNPGRLADMVDAASAYSTDHLHPEDAHVLCARCENAAERWAPVADELWAASEHFVSHSKR